MLWNGYEMDLLHFLRITCKQINSWKYCAWLCPDLFNAVSAQGTSAKLHTAILHQQLPISDFWQLTDDFGGTWVYIIYSGNFPSETDDWELTSFLPIVDVYKKNLY